MEHLSSLGGWEDCPQDTMLVKTMVPLQGQERHRGEEGAGAGRSSRKCFLEPKGSAAGARGWLSQITQSSTGHAPCSGSLSQCTWRATAGLCEPVRGTRDRGLFRRLLQKPGER